MKNIIICTVSMIISLLAIFNVICYYSNMEIAIGVVVVVLSLYALMFSMMGITYYLLKRLDG